MASRTTRRLLTFVALAVIAVGGAFAIRAVWNAA
jgi:hypothetical protein